MLVNDLARFLVRSRMLVSKFVRFLVRITHTFRLVGCLFGAISTPVPRLARPQPDPVRLRGPALPPDPSAGGLA